MMKILKLFFSAIIMFSANNAIAADWGPCTSTSGVHDYPVKFDIDIMDASKNKAGTLLRLLYSWAGVGQPFSFICECPDTYKTEKETLIKTVSNLSTATRKINSEQYYRLTEELEVMTMIQGPSMYIAVPANNAPVPNLNNASQDCVGKNLGQFGSDGYLSFYIAKPIQGEAEIPYTQIATLYASKKKIPIETHFLPSVLQVNYVSHKVVKLMRELCWMSLLVNFHLPHLKINEVLCQTVERRKKLISSLIVRILLMEFRFL